MTEQLVRLGAPREKVVYNAYGVDTAKFGKLCYDASPMQILAVGRFVEKKAPYLTILAFKKVLDELPGAKLVMVGAGELFDPCRQLIRSLHIERSVDLRGVLSHGQVAELMRTSQMFVQHSLVPASGDSEGTPVAILEAAASALPVVSTKHTGIVDAVIHGKTGWLVDEGDIDGMADYIRLLLRKPDLAVEMGKRGRQHVCDNFDSQKSVDNLRQIIENVVCFRKSEPPASNTERERHIVGVVQRL
jgi:glycosyltransferase involved in cell wall biosynthesis